MNNSPHIVSLDPGSSGGDQCAIHIFVNNGGVAYVMELELYGLNPRPDFTYSYNRTKAAEYAITRSRENFLNDFPYGDGDQKASVVGRVSGVGDSFVYSSTLLNHEQGFTGSAIFVSETFHLGGRLPMLSAVAPEQPCARDVSNANTGWRVCCANTAADTLATQSWTYHVGITNFFDDISNGSFINNIPYNDLATYIRFGATQGTVVRGSPKLSHKVRLISMAYLFPVVH